MSDEPPQSTPAETALPQSPFVALSMEHLDPTQFEELCFDLLHELGFVNVDWRKGTNKKGSPSDRGRDLVAALERADVDGHVYHETWFVDCKHYKKGVPPEALQGLMTWADAERPDTVLVMASGFLSNPAKDWLVQYRRNRSPAFRIRYWERPTIERLVGRNEQLMAKHDIYPASMRTVGEIIGAEEERYLKAWYGRKPRPGQKVYGNPLEPDIEKQMRKAMKEVEERFGVDELNRIVADDFSWGHHMGELSALRWVLGEDWGNGDT
jgi:hypothetical protein